MTQPSNEKIQQNLKAPNMRIYCSIVNGNIVPKYPATPSCRRQKFTLWQNKKLTRAKHWKHFKKSTTYELKHIKQIKQLTPEKHLSELCHKVHVEKICLDKLEPKFLKRNQSPSLVL